MSPSAGGLVVFLLSVQVIQSQDGWRVNYRQTDVCAAKGSTVYISCYYTYPPGIDPSDIKDRFWFTKEKDGEPVDLKTDSEYSGRVTYRCYSNSRSCYLTITDVRESDSAEYKFRFRTNKPGEKYTGSPGVTLCVTDGPQRPSVSVSPSAEMLEGGSVNLTCSTDANPAANYTWYKEHEDSPRASGQIFTITNFTAEHSGNYYCEAQNEMGRSNSTLRLITSSGKGASNGWIAAFASTSAIFLVIIMILTVLFIRRKKSPPSSRPAERPENNAQIPPAEPCYATLSFSRNQEDLLLYSNVSPARPPRRKEEVEEVLYSRVNFESSGAASE
uniref:B-cell receptor CD22 n=1 Tax=Gasterosteus aculeatus aculeatus TaxID=481459 RepID=A0AAQ4PJH7_GASAC